MPSADDLANFNRLRNNQVQVAIPPPPPLPQDLLDRFPSLVQWQEEFNFWVESKLGGVITGSV